ncbi:MAG: M50 family metallopeptidase [Nakamurella sp.]
MNRPAAPTQRRPPVWRRSITVARIAGIRIVVAPSWFVTAVLIVALAVPIVGRVTGSSVTISVVVSIVLAVLLGVSVLAHELGHCAVAALLGIGVSEVRLYLVGGYSELTRPPRSAKEEALVAAAGPAVSGLIALVCWALVTLPDRYSVAWLIALELALANGIVAVFNILPALPLDGGRVLRSALWRGGGTQRAGTIAGVIGGFIIAAGLLLWASVVLANTGRDGVLLAVIIATMAFFVAAGAWAEWPRRPPWPLGMTLSSVMRPVRPVEVGGVRPEPRVETGREVEVVTGPDGRILGIVDPQAELDRRVGVPANPPQNTSYLPDFAARSAQYPDLIPLEPEMIVMSGDQPGTVVERIVELSLPYVAVTDADGRIVGVVMRVDVEHVLKSQGLTRHDA